jgi:hypothetical protein
MARLPVALLVPCMMLDALALLSGSCSRRKDEDGRGAAISRSRPPTNTTVTIAKIDGKASLDGAGVEVSRASTIELVTNREDVTICALVHPLLTDTWWVQNLPSLPNRAASGSWEWRLTSFFGTETLGRREQYEIVAIAEQEQRLCVAGRTIKVDQAGQLLGKHPRSRVVTVNRVRD